MGRWTASALDVPPAQLFAPKVWNVYVDSQLPWNQGALFGKHFMIAYWLTLE